MTCFERVAVGRAPITCASQAEVVDAIERMVRSGVHGNVVVTPNIHHLRLLEECPPLREIYQNAALVLPDGWPVAWLAGRRAGRRVPVVAGSDLVEPVMRMAARSGFRVALIGGTRSSTAQKAAAVLEERCPGITIAFTDPFPRGQAVCGWEVDHFRKLLGRTVPDIAIVGLGAPRQEMLAWEMRDSPVGVWLCVGAGLSFLAGDMTRAPETLRRLRLEWLHRLVREPGRLLPRYIRDVPALARSVAGGRGVTRDD